MEIISKASAVAGLALVAWFGLSDDMAATHFWMSAGLSVMCFMAVLETRTERRAGRLDGADVETLVDASAYAVLLAICIVSLLLFTVGVMSR